MNNLLAKSPGDVIGNIGAPSPIQNLVNKTGGEGLSTVITNLITLMFRVAIILFLFMVIISAIQWITSGGDKEKVASARGRLTNAVVGVIILGLTWVITSTLGQLTGIDLPFK